MEAFVDICTLPLPPTTNWILELWYTVIPLIAINQSCNTSTVLPSIVLKIRIHFLKGKNSDLHLIYFSLKGKREQVQVVTTMETNVAFISLVDFHTSYKYAGKYSFIEVCMYVCNYEHGTVHRRSILYVYIQKKKDTGRCFWWGRGGRGMY